MTNRRLTTVLALLGLTAGIASALQGYDPAEHRQPPEETSQAICGLRPRVIELAIDRWTDEIARLYDFDEDQLYNTRVIFQSSIPAWLKENRVALNELWNDFLEARLGAEPPSPWKVADWSERALPVVDGFVDLMEGIGREVRPYLTEQQETLLDGHLAGFRVFAGFTTQRLLGWAGGEFDAQTEWPGYAEARRIQRQKEQEVQDAAYRADLQARGLAAPPTAMLAADATVEDAVKAAPHGAPAEGDWIRYVEEFIRRYQLNEMQQSSAQRYLRRALEHRHDYQHRSGARFAAAEQALRSANTDEERARARLALAERTKTLDRIFTQLKENLNKLPTRRQRLEAAQQPVTPASAQETRSEP